MKKFILVSALAVFAFTANAQDAIKKTSVVDNLSISLQGGAYEPLMGQNILKDARGMFRLSINKFFNPVVGVSLYGDAFINNNNGNSRDITSCVYPVPDAKEGSRLRAGRGQHTAIDVLNAGVNFLLNFNNLFCKYTEKQKVEFIGEFGPGWTHIFGYQDAGLNSAGEKISANGVDENFASTNAALTIRYNVNPKLAIDLRPAVSWQHGFQDKKNDLIYLNAREAVAQLTAGVTYTIGDNFTLCDKLYTQADLDAANANVNSLRNQIDALTRENGQLRTDLANAKKPVVNNTTVVKGKLAPVVIFEQGKYAIGRAQQPSVQMIATYLKNHPNSTVTVKGYASPEGNAAFNQKLSENRAKAVRDMLVNTYKIKANRIKAEGLGATSEIFPENDWNRVVTFIED